MIDRVLIRADAAHKARLETLRELQAYFQPGGKFCQQLSRKSTVVDHCLQFALSDPHDPDFQVECTCVSLATWLQ